MNLPDLNAEHWVAKGTSTRKARQHHYLFAHKVLPALFYRAPARFVDLLSAGKTRYLRFLWDRVGERHVQAESERMSSSALGCQVKALDRDTTVVLVILPRPEGTTEAYFVAVVYRPARRRLFKKHDAVARYVTLEYSWNARTGEPTTFLCEWTAKGTHANMGSGTEPTLNAFFDALSRLIGNDL